ncbi:hypothetical protein [Streptomyces sp. NPDC056883]|uniref:hypothetical protein n=1 Tax=Streptomyces sp. NPDC056883 TaxID=3345959 RepID=UPI00369B2F8E
MGDTYEPGRSRWTGITGWLMVGTALGALLCALTPVSPYPPLTAELCFAGASTVFACCWVVASYRARIGPLDKPQTLPRRRRGEDSLPWIFAFGMPFAVAAALMVLFTGSSKTGKEIERLDRTGYAQHRVTIVRLAGDPVHTPPSEDSDGWYNTDLVVRVPFDAGPREIALKAYHTSRSPEPGMRVHAYFAPAHPEEGVTGESFRSSALLLEGFVLVFAVPILIGAGALTKAFMAPYHLEGLRRFRPGVHLPALAILLCGLVLLLPVALEFQVHGYNRLPAFLASFTPALALAWVFVARRRW